MNCVSQIMPSALNPAAAALASGDAARIIEPWPYSYYTCVRKVWNNKTSKWYCRKGWFEVYDNEPGGFPSEQRFVALFCKDRLEHQAAISKALNLSPDEVVMH